MKKEIYTKEQALNAKKKILEWEKELNSLHRHLNEEREELRLRCPHLNVSYTPDPSGNNDSSYDCSLCGKSSRKPFGLVK